MLSGDVLIENGDEWMEEADVDWLMEGRLR
jgi:hypothetical protein